MDDSPQPQADLPVPSASPSVQFYIPAVSSILERRPRILKCGDLFGMFDPYGDIIPGPSQPDGLYHRDTRFLSGFQLLLDGRNPLLLSSTVQRNNLLLIADLTNPDLYDGEQRVLHRDSVHIVRAKFLGDTACHERLGVLNFATHPVALELRFLFEADFADLFEVRGMRRKQRGRQAVTVPAPDTVLIRYLGLDGVERVCRLGFQPAPDRLTESGASYRLDLAPKERRSIFVEIGCADAVGRAETRGGVGAGFFAALGKARRSIRQASGRAAAVSTSNDIMNEVLCRSMADLSMLVTDTAHGPYPYAGVPWFSTAFGRDGIITAMQVLWLAPAIARGVLRFLAATQATEIDPRSDAEPGKILHEMRDGEMARLGEVPFRRYYGTVDATPLFVVLAGMYWQRTGDRATITALWPHIQAAMVWLDRYGDRDGDGFLEYQRQGADGLVNQGWKDSDDAVFHADGRLAEGPIALCEVQAYRYAAKQAAALLARVLGHADQALDYERRAIALQDRFERSFWCEPLGLYALALDGRKAQCRVRTSNAGHALFSGICRPERARRVADALMGQDFFGGWGIRTVAASESRYNPMSYHNGSVWPHDNALIASGFARYGFKDEVLRVLGGLFDAASFMNLRRLPELFCGFRRRTDRGPTLYPVACSPQAWASATPFALLQACLGIEFDPEARQIRLVHPRLPDFLDEVRIQSLRLGDAAADLLIRRHGRDVTVHVLNRRGTLGVAITL